MSRYGKRRDLVVHEENPFSAETGPAALAEGLVALNSDVFSPTDGNTVAAGPVEVRGYAFAGGSGTSLGSTSRSTPRNVRDRTLGFA